MGLLRDMGLLDGKVALLTGASRGLGRQTALTFAREGADIVINALRKPEMEATAQEIRKLGRKTITVQADVSKKDEVKAMVDAAIQEFKRIDILVNNAGIPGRATLLDMTEDVWDRVVDVNLKGPFLCTQAVAPHMIRQRYGKIINISSAEGARGSLKSSSNYTSAKAGVIQMTKTHARELGAYGINVNCVAPGGFVTGMTYIGRTPEQIAAHEEERKRTTCLARMGTAQEMANLILFLASDESSYITAQTISCDGGRFDRM